MWDVTPTTELGGSQLSDVWLLLFVLSATLA